MHSNRLNHELYSEPSFPAPWLYLLSHTLSRCLTVGNFLPPFLVQFAHKFVENLQLMHSNRLNHELSFPATWLYLLSHTLSR